MSIFESAYGVLATVPVGWTLAAMVLLVLALAFKDAGRWVWTLATAAVLYALGAAPWLWMALAVPAVLFNVGPLRRTLLTRPLMALLRRLEFLPVISETERVAIDAGTVWVDRELFSGKPDFKRLLHEGYPGLTAEEQEFLDGPVAEVCRLTDDWEVQRNRDLPPEVWDFLKAEGFFGMIIPKKYGGLGFSASANSAVVGMLESRCTPLATTVMVPNSLGPAELLVHYGTEEQKRHYLPRLARGEDIPAFALTEPNAGSDAGAMSSHGTVFRGDDGELYLRLNWNKRYITLAPICTVLGLAFKLRDPDNLLGKGTDPGITCALVPTDRPGVRINQRHDPLGVPFHNGPTQGKDVVVPVDVIIGGAEGAGRGWQMLMESLAAGRGISLPASAAGGVKMLARVTGAYATVRKQFGTSIGRFEGIEQPLARIGGFAYLLEAARRYTNGGLDGGAKPAVVTAIAKYNFTELAREAVIDGMDILGGAAISLGPRNLLAQGYIGVPISITVEGANILTRTLIIFGQGAIRSHPYAYRQIRALAADDTAAFDAALWGHVGHVVRNLSRTIVLGLTRGWLAGSPVGGPAARYYRKLAWASARFALLADVAMAMLGGKLKRKGALTGRFADIFSWLYLGNAVLVRFEAEGRRQEDLPLLHWTMQYTLSRIQGAFDGLLPNLDLPFVGWLLRGPVAALWGFNPIGRPPADVLSSKVARIMQTPGAQRDALTSGIYVPDDESESLGRLERAFLLSIEAEAPARAIKTAVREGKLTRDPAGGLVANAVSAGVITEQQGELLEVAEAARDDAVQVDSFTAEEYFATAVGGAPYNARETEPTVVPQ